MERIDVSNYIRWSGGVLVLVTLAVVAAAGCDGETSAVPDSGITPTPDKGVEIKDKGPVGKEASVKPDGSPAKALTPGMIGQYSAVVSSAGQLYASAYEQLYGDLVVLSAATSALGTVAKEVVDGVPSGATPTGDPKGYRGGISAEGDKVGFYTDIALGPSGPAVSYHDATSTNRSLKLAMKSGSTWSSHHVDKAKGKKEIVGRHTSLLFIGGKPAIAYAVLDKDGSTTGTYVSELRFAQASKAAPAAAADWTVTVVDSVTVPCQELCDKSAGEVCVTATNQCQKTSGSCSPSCSSGQACVSGKCVAISAPTGLTGPAVGTGLWVRALAGSGGPVLVYHDSVKGTLKAAALSGGKWTTATVRTTANQVVGAFCAAAMDKTGAVHVAYQNRTKETLHYAQVNASTLKATVTETIDDGSRSGGQRPVGADPAIVVTAAGSVVVVYQDQLDTDLLYAMRSGANNWTPNKTSDAQLGRALKTGAKGYGFYSDLTESSAKVYGTTFFFDAKATPEGGLEFFEVK